MSASIFTPMGPAKTTATAHCPFSAGGASPTSSFFGGGIACSPQQLGGRSFVKSSSMGAAPMTTSSLAWAGCPSSALSPPLFASPQQLHSHTLHGIPSRMMTGSGSGIGSGSGFGGAGSPAASGSVAVTSSAKLASCLSSGSGDWSKVSSSLLMTPEGVYHVTP